ncbi:MAG: hypothetical protein KatS3mg110_4641 [Pirellulaceae bacterium]|nr:MAG: hypothetical protein KatS3mg110_0004 [Pirellulaceae bacterium]GIW96597.1 MAG: hypothetical protein KatS3mg110_4638 [Pirellulaceae bacterium]GIW96600.1 MAG: hypothetical protein KatS3mg110_4641 [Pirellulaceae bacterium]
MRSMAWVQMVTNAIGVIGICLCVMGYFCVSGAAQQETDDETAISLIKFCSDGVGAGAVTCSAAACEDAYGVCKPSCAGVTCNVPDACSCGTTPSGCKCYR